MGKKVFLDYDDEDEYYVDNQGYFVDCVGDSAFVFASDISNPTRDEGQCSGGTSPIGITVVDPDVDD